MTNAKELLANLLQAVQLLAADYETQVSQFPNFVHIPDELALTYSDCLLLADPLAAQGVLNQQQYSKLQKIDCYLEQMSDTEAYWTLDALKQAPEWQQIRLMGRDLLLLFNQQVDKPDLSWMNYVKGSITMGSHIFSVNGKALAWST